MSSQPRNYRLLWTGAALLVLIGAAMVIRRTFFLVPVLQDRYVPAVPRPGMPYFPDEGFVQNPWLTLVHILPALLFLVLGLLQFTRRMRQRPATHTRIVILTIALGIFIGVTGIIMGFRMAISGVNEISATTLFGSWFVFALTKAYLHLHKDAVLHREWMIRAYMTGLAVTTTRPIVGIFFATSRLTGLTAPDFFGAALWIGFTIHLIAAEWWINYTRDRSVESEVRSQESEARSQEAEESI